MEKQFSEVRIFRLDEFNYPKFRGKIIDLYLNAFTTGKHAQFIPAETAESTLDEMLRHGLGKMAFIGDRMAGVLIALPLSRDQEFPEEKVAGIPVETSLYIAEVMVHPDFRKRGVASQLLQTFLEHTKNAYTHTVIRVWDENLPALKLYEKLGLKQIAGISQTKFRTENETFEMQKIYMVKKIP